MWSDVTNLVSVVPVTLIGTRRTGAPDDEDEEDDDAEVEDEDDAEVEDDDAVGEPAEQAGEKTATEGAKTRAIQTIRLPRVVRGGTV
jgi:hypothetical protein